MQHIETSVNYVYIWRNFLKIQAFQYAMVMFQNAINQKCMFLFPGIIFFLNRSNTNLKSMFTKRLKFNYNSRSIFWMDL